MVDHIERVMYPERARNPRRVFRREPVAVAGVARHKRIDETMQ